MVQRIATVSIGLPLLVGAVWLGAPWFTVLVAIAAVVGTVELCTLARGWSNKPVVPVAAGASVALVIGSHVFSKASSIGTPGLPVIAGLAGLSIFWMLWLSRPGTRPWGWQATAATALYAGGLLAHAPILRDLDQGREWMYVLLSVTFAADTCAFLVGRALGSRPLAPSISPSKTWEGAIAAEIAAVAGAATTITWLGLDMTMMKSLLLGAILGVSGQLGDLLESRLKRSAGVKESGRLFPGHGGLLDRIDSIVFNLVVMYYFVS